MILLCVGIKGTEIKRAIKLKTQQQISNSPFPTLSWSAPTVDRRKTTGAAVLPSEFDGRIQLKCPSNDGTVQGGDKEEEEGHECSH